MDAASDTEMRQLMGQTKTLDALLKRIRKEPPYMKLKPTKAAAAAAVRGSTEQLVAKAKKRRPTSRPA